MRSVFVIALCAAMVNITAKADTIVLNSPDNNIEYTISDGGGQLRLAVSKDGTPVIESSEVVFMLDGKSLTNQCEIIGQNTYQIDQTYPTRGVHSMANDRCNGAQLDIRSQEDAKIKFDARAYDDGIAFRIVYAQTPDKSRTPDEATTFVIPSGSRVWYHDMYAHYEGQHQQREISDIRKGEWAAPPITIKLPDDGGYMCISEAALFNYAGMALQSDGNRGMTVRLGHSQPSSYPFAHDYNLEEAIRLSSPASISGDIITPWRCVIIADDLNGLVNSDLITNLSPEPDSSLFPDGVNTDWLKPGRSVWCWLDGGERSVEGMKEFSRMAGELGFEYNTVDAFWYRWTDEQIMDLVDYSAQFGVKVWLWRHGRDMRDPIKRKDFFDRCQRLGIVGVKLDAFSHESKEFIDMYQACLREAAEHHLMLNIHGSNKPTGERRSWPNEMSCEGIRGMENGKHQGQWATHNVTLPFTRFIAGDGDYTPMVFGERRLETSWCHQLATPLVLNSSVIFFGAHPQSMLDNPASELIKDMPSVWDKTVVLPQSEIGRLAAFARRSGSDWYLAVLNGQEATAEQFVLDFLGQGWYKATVYKDEPDDPAKIKREKIFCRNTDAFTANMCPSGGFIVKFTPAE